MQAHSTELSAPSLPPPLHIETREQLQAWVERLERAELIGVDTESDSFHRYREKVCLIQMSALGQDALIDPLALGDVSLLAPVFADSQRTKVFHDAVYDLVCLRRDFDFCFAGLFDTMLATRLLGWRGFGLAAVLEKRYGFGADKRMQRSDWTRRPLSTRQLTYAQTDTHFLERLACDLTAELREAGRLEWAMEEFARLPEIAGRISPRPDKPDANSFWRVRGVRALPPPTRGRIRALYILRERLAERLDCPPFKIFSDTVLVDLAKDAPASIADLRPRPGLRRAGLARFGRQIIAALRRAQPVKGSPPPGSTRRRRTGRFLEADARDRYAELRKLRGDVADRLGLDAEVLLGNAALEELAREPATSVADAVARRSELGGWRRQVITDMLVTGETPPG